MGLNVDIGNPLSVRAFIRPVIRPSVTSWRFLHICRQTANLIVETISVDMDPKCVLVIIKIRAYASFLINDKMNMHDNSYKTKQPPEQTV